MQRELTLEFRLSAGSPLLKLYRMEGRGNSVRRSIPRTKGRGIGFQPVRLQDKKDGYHLHHRTNVMKKRTGWKPIPREEHTEA